jgi:hypothetical protein
LYFIFLTGIIIAPWISVLYSIHFQMSVTLTKKMFKNECHFHFWAMLNSAPGALVKHAKKGNKRQK